MLRATREEERCKASEKRDIHSRMREGYKERVSQA